MNGTENETGVSEILGAILLVSVVAMAVTLVGVAVLSQPLPEKLPALTAEIITIGRTILITHNGGDALRKSDMSIMVDGDDLKNSFTRPDGSGWSSWSVGDSLIYPVPTGDPMPKGVTIYYIGGKSATMIQSIGVPSAVSYGGVYQPSADFSGSPASGIIPLNVDFTDSSSNTPTSWSWAFGDSGTSTDKNPSHQYTTIGTYTVSLTATNDAGTNTMTKTGYIVVNPPPAPIVSFFGTPLTGSLPLNVQFTDTSSNTPTSWSWIFGDSGTSTDQHPSHQYTNFGKYKVDLTAGNLGGSNTLSKPDYVKVCWGDNFNDNSLGSAWTTWSGTWLEIGQNLSQTSITSADPKKATISNSGQTFGANHEITAKVRINSWVEGQDMSRGGVSLFTGTGDGNGYNLLFHNNHNTVQFLDDKVAWGPSYTYTWTTGTWYWFKLKMDSGTLYGKVWQDGFAEPGSYPYSWPYSGRSGYPALNGGSADAAGYSTVWFDDVTVCPI